MKITVLGAGGGEVTGSAYLVEMASANVLVDCGFFQGARKIENHNRIPRDGAMRGSATCSSGSTPSPTRAPAWS